MVQKIETLLQLSKEVEFVIKTTGSCSRVLRMKCIKSIKDIKRKGICQIYTFDIR